MSAHLGRCTKNNKRNKQMQRATREGQVGYSPRYSIFLLKSFVCEYSILFCGEWRVFEVIDHIVAPILLSDHDYIEAWYLGTLHWRKSEVKNAIEKLWVSLSYCKHVDFGWGKFFFLKLRSCSIKFILGKFIVLQTLGLWCWNIKFQGALKWVARIFSKLQNI
jgi:hypothetical protein